MDRTLERSLQVDTPIALPPLRQEAAGIRARLGLKRLKPLKRPYLWMLLPALLLLTVFFLFPIANMIKYSFYTQVVGSTMQPDLTVENFGKFFTIDTTMTTTRTGAASGFVAMDSMDGQIFHLKWRRCR